MFMINKVSGEASGRPSLPFLTPAESAIANAASFVRTLTSSVLEPVRTTMAAIVGPGLFQGSNEPGGHGQHGNQHRHHTRDPDDHDGGGSDPLRRLRMFMAETAAI